MLDRPRRQAATERTRRCRRRQAAGVIVISLEIDGAVLDLLCRFRWLAEVDAADKRKIGAAIEALLSDASR